MVPPRPLAENFLSTHDADSQWESKTLPTSPNENAAAAVAAEADGELVVNPHLTIRVCSPDEVLIKHGTRSRISTLVADRQGRGVLGPVVEQFRTQTDPRAVLTGLEADDAARDAAAEFIATFRNRHYLISAGTAPEAAYAGLRFGSDSWEHLQALRVAVVGGGELARLLLQELATIGCQVEEIEEQGRSANDLGTLFDRSDHVVAALDHYSPSLLHDLNDQALATRRAWTSGYVDGSHVVLGPTLAPGGRPCYSDVETQIEAGFTMRAEYLTHLRALDGTIANGKSLPPGVGSLAAGWLIVGLMPALLGEQGAFDSRCVVVDLEGGSVDTADILCLPRCPACSPGRVLSYH